MLRLCCMGGSLLLGLTLLVGTGTSQDKSKKTDKVRGMLPAGFKDLNITAEQKAKIYSIQTDYRGKIDELEKKIKDLKAAEQKEVFSVLTEEQRTKYFKSKGIAVPSTKEKSSDKK